MEVQVNIQEWGLEFGSFVHWVEFFLERLCSNLWSGCFIVFPPSEPENKAWDLYFSKALLRGLFTEGNLSFKIDWASLIVGGFYCFCFVLLCIWGHFPSASPWGAYIWRGDLTEDFLCHLFGGLIFGGAYSRNFTVFFFLPLFHQCDGCPE